MTRPTGRWTFGRRFRYDVELEALLTLRDSDRARWEALGPATKVKLAFYEGCKATYEDSVRAERLPAGVEGARESAIGREQAMLQAVARGAPRMAVDRDDPHEQTSDMSLSHVERTVIP